MAEDLHEKYHFIAGTFLSAKLFCDYAFLLKEVYNTKVKGETTRLNRLTEAEAKVLRVAHILECDLKEIGCDIEVTENEIDGIETVFAAILTLKESDQMRVLEFIEEIKKDKEYELA